MKSITIEVFALFLLGLSLQANAADVMPAGNNFNWGQYTGVPGGIPDRQTIYKTLKPGDDIQSALNSCPAKQVVLLSAGTYSSSSPIVISSSTITLRGSIDAKGNPTTTINFSVTGGADGLINFDKGDFKYPANNWGSYPGVGISSGLTQGSQSITFVSAATGLVVGQLFAIDQLDDNNLVDTKDSQEGGGVWAGRNGNRALNQIVRATKITGNTVEFSPPLYSSYWNSSLSPQGYWWGNGLSQVIQLSGVENIRINRPKGGGGLNNVHFGSADSCWMKNVWSTQCYSGHVRTAWALNCEIRDCYLTIHDDVGSATYSLYVTYTFGTLFENNIMYNTPCALGMMESSGNAVAYNYTALFPYSQADWLPETMMLHGGHCDHNLFEGNYNPSYWVDYIHGNTSFNSFVRNRLTAWESGKTGSTRAINVEAQQFNIAVLGNMMGTDKYHNSYDTGGQAIYNVDSGSLSSMTRKGNWFVPSVTGVPAGETLGASQTIQVSYLHSTKPSWFASLTFPWVDPTKTTSPDPLKALPAGYRFANGAWPPADTSPKPKAPANFRVANN